MAFLRLAPLAGGLVKTCLLAFFYAIYYAILFFTTLFTTLREAPANDLYVFKFCQHVPNRVLATNNCPLRSWPVCGGNFLNAQHGV